MRAERVRPNKASLFPGVIGPANGARAGGLESVASSSRNRSRPFSSPVRRPPRIPRPTAVAAPAATTGTKRTPSPFLAARLIPQRAEAAPGRQPLREPISQTPSSHFSYSSVPPINRGCFAFSTRFALLDSISTLLTITIHHNASPKTGISCE